MSFLLEDLPELRSILAVQNLMAKIPENPMPLRLNENEMYSQWIQTYRSNTSLALLDKEIFGAFVKEAGVYLQTQEEEAFQDCEKIGPMEEEELISPKADAFVEAVKIKLARHMCMRTAASFELLDKDKDGERCNESIFIGNGFLTAGAVFFTTTYAGKVHVDEVEKLLRVAAHGNGTEWLKS